MAIATDRAGALSQTTNDLEQAGLIFNDAVRLSNGGIWSAPADDNNQLNYASMYEADISILQQDIASAIAIGATVNGVAVTPSNASTLTEIQGQLAQLATAAPNAVGTSAAAAQAQGVLHTDQQLILSEIAGDANLQKALAANGVANDGTGAVDQGFQALPAQAADDAGALATATAGANLSDIGTVFNAATNLANGGLNASNITEFDNDMKAVAAGLQNFINNGGLAAAQANTAAEQAVADDAGISLSAAQALTGVHVQTMLDQVQDQINRFDTMYAVNPNIAARSTNDNLLDIIDIVQGDAALSASAGNTTGNPSHDGGFAEQPGYLAGTIQHYQDSNLAQTDFWSAFIAGANNLNNALTAEANGTAHLDTAGLNSLIQQVQGYQQLGNSFDAAQGGIFGARFDNELLGGTLTADTSTSLQALQDILANGGTVSTADAAKLIAAGTGYVADATDVSGNNTPFGGGTYVGTSTTVAGATTTHIADANTTTSGNVDGNEHPTDTPASPMNNGFGVTFPDPAGTGGTGGTGTGTGTGAGGAGGTGGTGGDGAGAVIATDRAGALSQTTNDLEQAGLIFNDAVRLSNGGIWSAPADDNNQLNYASMYEADISILQQDIASAIAIGATVNGVAVTPSNASTLTEIQGQLAQLATAAPNAVGTSAAAAQAQGVLHTDQQLILSEIAGDANLQKALAANGVANDGTGAVDQGFQALPAQAADDAGALATATAGANLSDIGTVFNAATNLANGGLNASNITEFDNDMKAVAAGLQNFINNGGLAAAQANTAAEQAVADDAGISLSAAQALTGVHVQTMLDQVQDQINRFDTMYAVNPNIAARSTNDNLLDIIDIVQGDAALSASAGNTTGNPSHDGGFAEQPGYLAGTIQHYQDSNLAQTDFWSAFIAGANNLNNALTAEANGTAHLDTAGLNSLIQQVQGYQQLGNSFDAAQGGIFGARFDNELLGGTLTADTSTSLQALQDILANGGTVSTADAAKLIAAGTGYVADATDVSGNNTPFGGGTYVGTSTTVAGATTTHIADANTTTSGNVDGNEHPTDTPASPMNNGFGVTFPDPAGTGGTGGTVASGSNGGGGSSPAGDDGNGGGNTQAGGQNGSSSDGQQSGSQGSQASNGNTDDNGNQGAQGNNGNTGTSGDQGHPGDGQCCGHDSGTSGHSGGSSTSMLSGNVASDLASLIQALQSGNKGAINTALASLESDIGGNGGGGATGGNGGGGNGNGGGNSAGSVASNGGHDASGVGGPYFGHHHFEMMWHHA